MRAAATSEPRIRLDDPTLASPSLKLDQASTYLILKRAMDLLIVLIAIPAILILVAIAAVLIWASMGRPIFFRQERVGFKGSRFWLYKLRTMRSTLPNERLPATTTENDPRVTKVGKLLRQSHVDELPQLWNVLKGDMSLIGPRPEQVKLVEEYRRVLPHYDVRHMVKPGLSGWAQVHAGYAANLEDTRVKLEHDLYYVSQFGPRIDLRTALLTVKVYCDPRYVR